MVIVILVLCLLGIYISYKRDCKWIYEMCIVLSIIFSAVSVALFIMIASSVTIEDKIEMYSEYNNEYAEYKIIQLKEEQLTVKAYKWWLYFHPM